MFKSNNIPLSYILPNIAWTSTSESRVMLVKMSLISGRHVSRLKYWWCSKVDGIRNRHWQCSFCRSCVLQVCQDLKFKVPSLGSSHRQRCHINTVVFRNVISARFRSFLLVGVRLCRTQFSVVAGSLSSISQPSFRTHRLLGNSIYCLPGHSALRLLLLHICTIFASSRRS